MRTQSKATWWVYRVERSLESLCVAPSKQREFWALCSDLRTSLKCPAGSTARVEGLIKDVAQELCGSGAKLVMET